MSEQKNYADMSDSEKKKEDWMNSKWRPAMGWLYMGVCFADFVLFPVLWSILQATMKVQITQWQPLTLQGAGLFHLAMGAVLGLAAWGRTQEKLGGANNGGLQSMAPISGSTFGSSPASSFGSSSFGPTPTATPSSFGSSSFGSASSFSSPAPTVAVSSTAMPAVKRPVVSGPIDDDYMPPRD